MKNVVPIMPDWDKISKDKLDDSKYNIEFPKNPYRPETMVPFPGYIDNDHHPFVFYNMSAKDENGKLTNKFCSTDNIEEFKKNLKKQPKTWKYRKKDVTYEVNSSGYRTYHWDEINWKEAIVIFGCSCTFGVGLAEDETISHYIEKYTGRQVVNLAFPGGSNKAIVDNAASMINKFEMPHAVIINWTTTDRTRYYHEHGIHEVGPWDAVTKNNFVPNKSISKWSTNMNDFWIKNFYNPTNELAMNYYLSTHADAMFNNRTKYIKISFFPTSAHATRSEKHFAILNEARDLVHPGEKNSIQIANYVKKRLNEI